MNRTWLPWLVSSAALVIALLLRAAMTPVIGTQLPFVTLFGAIVVATWCGDWRTGVAATVLGYVAVNWFFMEPVGAFTMDADDTVGLLAYLFTSSLLVALTVSTRSSRTAAVREFETCRATFLSIGDGVISTDARAIVTEINPSAQQLTGWSPEDAIGKPLADVFNIVNEDTRQTVPNPVDKALATGKVVGLANHTVLISKDGTQRPIDDSAAPIVQPDGLVIGCVLVFHDVSEARRASKLVERSEGLLKSITDLTPDLIFIKDRDRRLIFANPAMRSLVGMEGQDLIGEPASAPHTVDAERAAIESHDDNVIGRGETVVAEEAYTSSSVGPRTYLTTRSPLRDRNGEIIGVVGVSHDITERKRSEQALRDADRRKDEFLATLAHELRNPLQPISSGLEILSRQATEAQSAVVEVLKRNVAQLVRLVDELLDVGRITTGKIVLRQARVELGAVVRQALEMHRPGLEAKRLRFELHEARSPLFVQGDAFRLVQVFSNLLSNACKFTFSDGRIEIQLNDFAGMASVSIKDDGIGIESDDLSRIFEMFTQAGASPTSHGSSDGLGIGLALSRRIVELHNGQLQARSDGHGKGSTFTVSLPLVS